MNQNRQADALKAWEDLTIADNFIFQKVMRKKRLCKRLIENILNIKIRRITFPETEKDIRVRRDSKSVRLDVYVEDDQGTLYDIEMQTTDYATPDELPKRTRYYQAMMDMDVLNKGELYTTLRRTYIIFICTFDPFERNELGRGRSFYTFRETCQEEPRFLMGDDTTKIFLNSKGSREGINRDLAAFLDYIEGKTPQGKFAESIAEAVETAKENKEMKVEYMTFYMELRRREEKGRAEGREEGRAEGRAEGLAEGEAKGTVKGRWMILMELVHDGVITMKEAAKRAGMTEEAFRKLTTH
ncbi:Rpn family recombination-promoting nuclease/putative transposase [uncultured Mitsuokella sp.]|uniref:Rpn family recombination-promoting nuclease/putative transposase n=1 Tax=uncultured Mitsuokella sp. TaxID=453120 RepID=UPI0026DA9C79|nr:Rpn family recombination-promoting nuclease/putative transposase [uncultured Mitsuokella sp.]